MSLFRKIVGGAFVPSTPSAPATPTKYIRGQAVGDSKDLRRVLALPKRPRPPDSELMARAAEIERRLGIPGAKCECATKYAARCCQHLLPVQAWALDEAAKVGGILGPIGVGHGKTLIGLLTPMVVPNCKVAVLLVPPNLKAQLLGRDWHFYGQHWTLPNLAGGRWYFPGRPVLHVVAFSELSGSKSSDLLSRLRPDVVVVDEAHNVRNRTAARTKRFLRYFTENPNARLFSWSGTLTSRSLRDYAHLANLALREGSPTPHHWPTVEEWAGHLDPSDFRSPPGRLVLFGSDARTGFRDRVVGTSGVISSGDSENCQASLVFSQRNVQAPAKILQHITAVEASWQRPDGEELVDPMSVGRCVRELSCGFFYRWRWPRKEPVEVIERWLKARKEWHKELRETLKLSRPHMDSPLLCAKAAIRWQQGYVHIERNEHGQEVKRHEVPPHTKSGPLPVWQSATWGEWERVRDTARPETEAIWLDDFLVRDAVAWLDDGPGLLWYEFDAFGRRVVAAGSGRYVHASPGDEGNRRVLELQGTEPVAASIRAHGTGKNLQLFSRNLVANPPSDGATWEQLVGRTHRQGQREDEVTVEVYRHTEPFANAVDKARELARYIEESFGSTQKLVSKATFLF